MARNYSEEYARRKERAKQAGYEGGYAEQRKERRHAEQILGRRPWEHSAALRRNPRGEATLIRAWTEGKLMSQARKSGNRAGVDQHRRNMDFALLDLSVERPDFDVQDDFWYH